MNVFGFTITMNSEFIPWFVICGIVYACGAIFFCGGYCVVEIIKQGVDKENNSLKLILKSFACGLFWPFVAVACAFISCFNSIQNS